MLLFQSLFIFIVLAYINLTPLCSSDTRYSAYENVNAIQEKMKVCWQHDKSKQK